MKQRYIPLEKRSKREQCEYHSAQRGSWRGVNPVTRKPPNPKAYNRKKSGQRYEHEPLPNFLFILAIYKVMEDSLYRSIPVKRRAAV